MRCPDSPISAASASCSEASRPWRLSAATRSLRWAQRPSSPVRSRPAWRARWWACCIEPARGVLLENRLDPLPVVGKEGEHSRLVGVEHRIVERQKLPDDRIVLLLQDSRIGIETAHHPQAGRCRADHFHAQVGAIFPQEEDEPPYVATPEGGSALAFGGVAGQGVAVVNQYRRP